MGLPSGKWVYPLVNGDLAAINVDLMSIEWRFNGLTLEQWDNYGFTLW